MKINDLIALLENPLQYLFTDIFNTSILFPEFSGFGIIVLILISLCIFVHVFIRGMITTVIITYIGFFFREFGVEFFKAIF